MLFFALSMIYTPAFAGLARTDSDSIQSHVTDPKTCLGTVTANSTFCYTNSCTYNITGWTDIIFYPTSTGYITYNGVASEIEPIYANQPNLFVIHSNTTQIVPSVSAVVCGMTPWRDK
jgi:hypothetical protein